MGHHRRPRFVDPPGRRQRCVELLAAVLPPWIASESRFIPSSAASRMLTARNGCGTSPLTISSRRSMVFAAISSGTISTEPLSGAGVPEGRRTRIPRPLTGPGRKSRGRYPNDHLRYRRIAVNGCNSMGPRVFRLLWGSHSVGSLDAPKACDACVRSLRFSHQT
jgi:hypothetical protein